MTSNNRRKTATSSRITGLLLLGGLLGGLLGALAGCGEPPAPPASDAGQDAAAQKAQQLAERKARRDARRAAARKAEARPEPVDWSQVPASELREVNLELLGLSWITTWGEKVRQGLESLQAVKDVTMKGKWAVVVCRKTLPEQALIDEVRARGFDAMTIPAIPE